MLVSRADVHRDHYKADKQNDPKRGPSFKLSRDALECVPPQHVRAVSTAPRGAVAEASAKSRQRSITMSPWGLRAADQHIAVRRCIDRVGQVVDCPGDKPGLTSVADSRPARPHGYVARFGKLEQVLERWSPTDSGINIVTFVWIDLSDRRRLTFNAEGFAAFTWPSYSPSNLRRSDRRGRKRTGLVSSLWLADEAKKETDQKEYEMHDGATTTNLRCFDKTRPQQRY